MFPHLVRHLSIARVGPGRPRTWPERLRADKAYSSRAIRRHLRERRIVAVIPEPADQQGHRKRRGSRGGRPPAFDREDYRNRNVVERGFCHIKQWRGLATRYDKLALTFRGGGVLKAIVTWLRALGDTPWARWVRTMFGTVIGPLRCGADGGAERGLGGRSGRSGGR